LSESGDTLYAMSGTELAVAALRGDPRTGALSEAASPAGCVEFGEVAMRGCTGIAPRWSGEVPHTVAAPSDDGLLLSAVERHGGGETVVEVTGSLPGAALVVNDVRRCVAGGCRRLRGANSNQVGPLAVSANGRSVYVAGVHGIAQIRLP
jgi:hypothetical protein